MSSALTGPILTLLMRRRTSWSGQGWLPEAIAARWPNGATWFGRRCRTGRKFRPGMRFRAMESADGSAQDRDGDLGCDRTPEGQRGPRSLVPRWDAAAITVSRVAG